MKKELILACAVLTAVLVSGCAGVATMNGGVAPVAMGPTFFAEVKANAVIPQYPATDAKVIKRNVTATAQLKSFFTCVNIGDLSYATLKAEALKQAPGATDLTDVQMDYAQKTICGITTITVKMTATAIRY